MSCQWHWQRESGAAVGHSRSEKRRRSVRRSGVATSHDRAVDGSGGQRAEAEEVEEPDEEEAPEEALEDEESAPLESLSDFAEALEIPMEELLTTVKAK